MFSKKSGKNTSGQKRDGKDKGGEKGGNARHSYIVRFIMVAS